MALLSVIVQFIRNLLCVIKSLVPSVNSSLLVSVVSTSTPFLQQVTILEALIGLTQLAAVYFNIISGVRNFRSSYIKNKKCKQIISGIDKITLLNTHRNKLQPETICIARSVVENEISSSYWCGIIVGILEVIFGISFFFLFMNSYHLHTSSWPKPVIDALIFMEIGLLYILGIMIHTIVTKMQKSRFIRKLIDELESVEGKNVMSIHNYVTASSLSNAHDAYIRFLYLTMEEFYSSSNCLNKLTILNEVATDELAGINEYLVELQNNIYKKNQMDTASIKKLISQLETQCSNCDVILDYVYLLLNAIAGYGYLLGIFAFYFRSNNVCKLFMFGLSDVDGDWWGNLAGDSAWTIEPLLIILVEAYYQKQNKVKND